MQFEEFNNKNIFITGVASGIGEAQALAFLQQGARVYGFDIKTPKITHQNFSYTLGDVANKADVDKAVAQLSTIDILLNTAGVLDGFAKTLDTDEALWDRIMNCNIKGTYLVTNAVLPKMLAQGAGVILNMASIAGLVAGGGGAAYTASKHAIIGYTKQLDQDYCRQGIRANAIAPGAIKTPMNAADFAGDGAMAEWVASETPAGRWAQPQEVANLTLFLASSMADYIHSVTVPIDGGWLGK